MAEATGEYADRILQQLKDGDLDPAAVDIEPFVDEDYVMTPALWEHLPEAKREAYNAAVAERDAQILQDRQADLGQDQQDALNTLESAFADDVPTETVDVGEATLTVRTRFPGTVESAIEAIRDEADKPPEQRSFRAVSGELLDAIPALIVDDSEPDEDPYRWTDREVWAAYYERHGSEALFEAFEAIATPALQRMEELDSFRDGAARRGRGGARPGHQRSGPGPTGDDS
jgi:hypothetical protein